MSSTLRSLSQIGSRIKYLLAVDTCTTYTPIANAQLNAVMTGADFTNSVTSGTRPFKTLFRDMGDSVTTVNVAGQHVGLFRSAQRVAGTSSEGVPTAFETETVYVQVWSADPAITINVVRVG